MSTPEGHSALQALHSTQRSSASAMRSPVMSAAGRPPLSAWRSRLARPRVECSSSRVTMKEGHMAPSNLRQAPCPLHCSSAPARPPSARKSSTVAGVSLTVSGPRRRLSSKGGVSMILPGLSSPCGSKARLRSRKAPISAGPNSRSMKTPRTMPSPCSPLRLPPNSTTRSAICEAIPAVIARPSCCLRLTSGRMCRQPSPAWP